MASRGDPSWLALLSAFGEELAERVNPERFWLVIMQ